MLRRLSATLAVLAAIHAGVLPAYAEEPYFRFRSGMDQAQSGLYVSGGPTGTYYVRQNGRPATGTPSASMSPVTWSYAGTLPPGIGVNAADGTLTGGATGVDNFGPANLVATYTPSGGGKPVTAQGPGFFIDVLGAPSLSYAPPAAIASGSTYRLTPTVSGVLTGSYVLNQAVPAGLSLDRGTGVVTVLPSASGSYPNLAVTVTDFDGQQATSAPFTITVGTRSATVSVNAGSGVTGVPYSAAISTTGIVAPATYQAFQGALPPGLSFCASPDRICGTPTKAGSYSFYVAATGSDGLASATQNPVVISVSAPSLNYPNASASVGKAFSVTPSAQNLSGATYAFQGTPPSGVGVDPSTGVVSGTLSTNGANTLRVVATTPYGSTPSNAFTVTGTVDAFSVSSSSNFVQAHVGYPISQQFSASPAASGLTWAVTQGQLPDGLTLVPSSGLVWGKGTSPANVSNVVLTASVGGTSATSDPQHYQILAAPSVTAASAYTATAGQAFNLAFTAANLIGAGSFSTDSTKLPPGLSLASNGTLSGTPTQAGTYDGIVLAVTDAYDGATGNSQAFTIEVTPSDGTMMAAGVPSSYKVRQNNALTTQAPTVSGTSSQVVWSLAPESAPLPAGMTLDPSTGIISGTPTTAGDTAGIILQATEVTTRNGSLETPFPRIRLASNDPSWTVVAQAATGGTGRTVKTRPFTITVGPPLTISNVRQTYQLKVASPISIAPQANGVMGGTTWTLSGGTLPNAAGFDPTTGRIAGPALVAGRVPGGSSGQLKLTATDSFDGATATSNPFDLTIDPGLAVIGPTALTTKAGQAFSSGQQFYTTNAIGALTWQVIGSLPAGFAMNPATGEITGQSATPSITGDLRVQAMQADGTSGVSAPFTFSVQGGLQIAYQTNIIAHINVPMPPITPSVSGAQGTVGWNVASGALPPGITLNPATGALAGTPTSGGFFYNIQVGATDSAGNSGVSAPITLYVNNGLSWGKLIQAPVTRAGQPFTSNQPQVVGATGPVTYRLVASLWDWKVDPNTGIITGTNTPDRYGSYIWPDWLVATDATGAAISHPMIMDNFYGGIEWACSPYCNIDVPANTVVTANQGYVFNLIGKATYSKVDTADSPWPAWLTLNTTTGAAYGLPPGPGSYGFTTVLTDGFDNTTVSHWRGFNVRSDMTGNSQPTFQNPASTCAVGGQFLDTGPGTVVNMGPNTTIAWHDYFGTDLSVNKPGWMTFDPTSGRIYGTVPTDGSGDWSSGGLSSNETATDPDPSPPTSIWNGGLYVNSYARFDFNAPNQGTTGYVVGNWYDPSDPNQRFTMVGGRDNPRIFQSGGQLPPGLTLDSSYWHDTYWLYGQPTTPGTYTFTITATATQCSGQLVQRSKDFTVTVTDATAAYVQSPLTLYARVGVPMRGPKPTVVNLPAGSDPTQFRWSWNDYQSPPPGLYIDQTDGAFAGTPTQVFNAGFKYTAFQCCYYGYFDLRGLQGTFVVTPGPAIQQADVTLPTGLPASVAPNATGFAGQVTWKGANLPPGLGVDPGNGAVVGTPTTTGTYANVTITGTETTRASSGPSDPGIYPTATSNPFTITVTGGPYITGVADQSRIIGSPFDVEPVANAFSGAVTWRVIGNLPEGVTINPSTGVISGGATKYGVKPIQVVATDGTGASATSVPFNLTVTDRNGNVPPDGSATWTWGPQVCTYGCVSAAPAQTDTATQCTVLMGQTICPMPMGGGGGASGGGSGITPGGMMPGNYSTPTPTTAAAGTCSGRQLQYCTGSGCEASVRGCDAPYSGGDSSNPIGSVAVACINPSLDPSQNFCPKPTATGGTGGGTTSPGTGTTDPGTGTTDPGTGTTDPSGGTTAPPAPAGSWYYRNFFRQTKGTNGFIVNYYSLTCMVGAAAADNSQCGTPPTSIGQCMVNGYGVGTCGSGVPFTDGITQQAFTNNTSNWFGN